MSDTASATGPQPPPWFVPLARRARLIRQKDIVDRKGLNQRIAVGVTGAVGTMWAFYTFALIEFGWMALATWGFLRHVDPYPFAFLLFLGNIVQLLLMPLIMVGQNVQSAHADARAEADFEVNEKAEAEIEKLLAGLRVLDERTLDIVKRLEAERR
jgi:uncharacterized membrane protein